MSDWPLKGLLEIDMRDYNIDPTGVANNNAAFQAAIDSIGTTGDTRGGTILVPPGDYTVGALTKNINAPIFIQSPYAAQGNVTGSPGVTFMPSANGQTILTIGDGVTGAPGAVVQEGGQLRNINFHGNGFTGITGAKFSGINHMSLYRVGAKAVDIGVLYAGKEPAFAARDSAWHIVQECTFYGCLIACIKTYDAFGLILIGGDLEVTDPGTGQSYGLWLTGGSSEATQSVKAFGTFFDGINHPSAGRVIGVFIDRAHECLFSGCKFEQLDIGAEVNNLDGSDSSAGAMNTFRDCTFVASGVGDIGIQVDANASATLIAGCSMTSVTTGVVNNGARTKIVDCRLDVATPISGSVAPEIVNTDLPSGMVGYQSANQFFRFTQTNTTYGIAGGYVAAQHKGFSSDLAIPANTSVVVNRKLVLTAGKRYGIAAGASLRIL